MNGRWILVDDQEELLEPTRRRLERLYPEVSVSGFGDALSALADIRDERTAAPAVLVTDLRMPGMSGLELVLAARAIVPQLPTVLVTAYASPELGPELRRLSGIEILEKPFSIEALVAAVERSLATSRGLSGSIGQAEFADLVQMFVFGQASGRLEIRQNERRGEIWFESGRIVYASCRGLEGEAAFYEMMTWKSGQFALSRGEGQAPGANINSGWQHLLLEGARRIDDGDRGFDEGDLDHELDCWNDDSVESKGSVIGMSSARIIEESLFVLSMLDGFIAACCVDRQTGALLGSRGGGVLDLEAEAAGNAELLRAKHDSVATPGIDDKVEDILITLAKQYHLIRPLGAVDGRFIYLVLDRKRSNLGLARHKLAVAERNLAL